MPDLLATIDDLADALGVEVGDLDQPRAQLALELSTAAVQGAAGQRIVEVVDDEVTIDLDADDCGPYLYLPEGPVTAVTSATVGATAVTDYITQLTRRRLWRSAGWRSSAPAHHLAPSTATVVYTHGYPADSQDIQLGRGATLSLARVGYGNTNGNGAVVREQLDDYSVQYAEMETAISGALDPDGALAKALHRKYGRPARSARLIAQR